MIIINIKGEFYKEFLNYIVPYITDQFYWLVVYWINSTSRNSLIFHTLLKDMVIHK